MKTRNQRKNSCSLLSGSFLPIGIVNLLTQVLLIGMHCGIKTNTWLHLEAKARLVIASGTKFNTSSNEIFRFAFLEAKENVQ